mmetsp:Transcript_17587/g.21648  ORF Transcript_17587/g.21648 Transcript_17587/m.21648 type:complete len:251 (-) Transcript_17587:758-1510(-)
MKMSGRKGSRKGRKRKEAEAGVTTSKKRSKNDVNLNGAEQLESKILRIFLKYAHVKDPNRMEDMYVVEPYIGTDGMLQFCEDLGLEPEDPFMISLSYYMEAKDMGIYTQTEFLRGLCQLKCCTLEDIKKTIPKLRSIFSSDKVYTQEFSRVYKYCYDWACEPGQKSLGRDMALSLWRILLEPFHFEYTNQWLGFIGQQKENVRGIPKDTWLQFLTFISFVRNEGLEAYDADLGAFPCIIDAFVDTLKSKT